MSSNFFNFIKLPEANAQTHAGKLPKTKNATKPLKPTSVENMHKKKPTVDIATYIQYKQNKIITFLSKQNAKGMPGNPIT